MKANDIVIAVEDTYHFDKGDVGLLVAIDRGPFVQWNSRTNVDPYERDVNGKHIEVLYSS